jgi:hypothetical protein
MVHLLDMCSCLNRKYVSQITSWILKFKADPCTSSFQGFDSGIYSIIISDSRFIDYFNVGGARAGVVASMGTF